MCLFFLLPANSNATLYILKLCLLNCCYYVLVIRYNTDWGMWNWLWKWKSLNHLYYILCCNLGSRNCCYYVLVIRYNTDWGMRIWLWKWRSLNHLYYLLCCNSGPRNSNHRMRRKLISYICKALSVEGGGGSLGTTWTDILHWGYTWLSGGV